MGKRKTEEERDKDFYPGSRQRKIENERKRTTNTNRLDLPSTSAFNLQQNQPPTMRNVICPNFTTGNRRESSSSSTVFPSTDDSYGTTEIAGTSKRTANSSVHYGRSNMPEMEPTTARATSKQMQDSSISRKTAQREEKKQLAPGMIPEDIGLFADDDIGALTDDEDRKMQHPSRKHGGKIATMNYADQERHARANRRRNAHLKEYLTKKAEEVMSDFQSPTGTPISGVTIAIELATTSGKFDRETVSIGSCVKKEETREKARKLLEFQGKTVIGGRKIEQFASAHGIVKRSVLREEKKEQSNMFDLIKKNAPYGLDDGDENEDDIIDYEDESALSRETYERGSNDDENAEIEGAEAIEHRKGSCFRNVRQLLAVLLQLNKVEFGSKVKLRLCLDGTPSRGRVGGEMVRLNVCLVDEKKQPDLATEHAIGVFLDKELPETIAYYFADVWHQLNQLQSHGVEIDGERYGIELYWSSDIMAVIKVFGAGSTQGQHFCPICTKEITCESPEAGDLRLFEDLEEMELLMASPASERMGQTNMPLLRIPASRILIDPLHMFARIIETILKLILIKLTELQLRPVAQKLVKTLHNLSKGKLDISISEPAATKTTQKAVKVEVDVKTHTGARDVFEAFDCDFPKLIGTADDLQRCVLSDHETAKLKDLIKQKDPRAKLSKANKDQLMEMAVRLKCGDAEEVDRIIAVAAKLQSIVILARRLITAVRKSDKTVPEKDFKTFETELFQQRKTHTIYTHAMGSHTWPQIQDDFNLVALGTSSMERGHQVMKKVRAAMSSQRTGTITAVDIMRYENRRLCNDIYKKGFEIVTEMVDSRKIIHLVAKEDKLPDEIPVSKKSRLV